MEDCHSPDIFTVTLYDIMTVATITFEAFAGLWINALIISVICNAWVKKKTLNSNEKILLFLGFSRFWYLCLAWVNYFLEVIYPNYFYVHPIFPLVESTQSFFICSNFWFSASLCIFYCIKIANFRNSFFIYLKEKIDRIVPWLLLGSEIFSLGIGILDYDIIDKGLRNKANLTCQGINWKANIRIEEYFFKFSFITGFLFATSFMAVILSAFLLLFSLWRHKRNMQTNSMKDVSTDAHIKAMKSILSFLVMYSINFVSIILALIYEMKNENYMMFLIYSIQYSFPSVHSLILIFSNPKLKVILLRILPCVKCKDYMK